MKSNKFYLLNIILPLIIGSLIYLFIDFERLIILRYIKDNHFLNFSSEFNEISFLSDSLKEEFLKNLRNYLPDALWFYSLMSFLLFVWKKTTPFWKTHILIISLLLIPIIFEISQLFNFLPGTFDILDIVVSYASGILAIEILDNDIHLQTRLNHEK